MKTKSSTKMKSKPKTTDMKHQVSILTAALMAILSTLLYMIPSPIDPEPYIFHDGPPKLEGVLQVNHKLQKVKKLFQDEIIGPESYTIDSNGVIYTGSADGKIWKISGETAQVLMTTGSNHSGCGTFAMEPICGRPKGMKINPTDGLLYVVDSYKGLMRVNTSTGVSEVLLTGINAIPFKFLNSLDISSDGIVYFTDSSSKWDRRNYRYEVVETNNLGRVVEYNPATRNATLIKDGLYLANGLSLSNDENHVIVAEMSVCKLQKIYVKGPKKGQMELFYNNLPGYPDNIKSTPRSTYFVGLSVARFEGSSPIGSFLDLVGPYPAIKRLVAKVFPFELYNILLPKHTILLEVDETGSIVNSFHDPTGETINGGLGEAYQVGDKIYVGHFNKPYVGIITVKDLYDN